MKIRYIFIPTILITILIIGICKHFYNLDLLSMDHMWMIIITSSIALFTIFFGISVCAYEASEAVAKRQTEQIDRYVQFLGQHINNCFKDHDALTKDIVTQSSLRVVETMKELALAFNEGDDARAKILGNLLNDIKVLSISTKNYVLDVKNLSLRTEQLSKESMERLDNVLICLRGNDVENEIDDVEENEVRVIGE